MSVSDCYINDNCTNTLMQKRQPFNKVPRRLIEQNADPVLLTFKKQKLGLHFAEQILTTNPRCTRYSQNQKRIIFKEVVLYRQNFNYMGKISHLKVLLPGQLKDTLLNSLQREAKKHAIISKMMQEIRQKYLFASIASRVRKRVKSNLSPRQTKRQLTTYTRTHQYTGMGFRSRRRYANRHSSRTPTKWRLRKHHHSNWCILKICICIPSPTAVTTAKVIINIMTGHAYFPIVLITDKASAFISNVIH